MKTKDDYSSLRSVINPFGWYFYETELDGKKIRLPISGIALALRISVNSVIDKALEIASRDACCSQQSERGLR